MIIELRRRRRRLIALQRIAFRNGASVFRNSRNRMSLSTKFPIYAKLKRNKQYIFFAYRNMMRWRRWVIRYL